MDAETETSSEIQNFVKVWTLSILCFCYCFFICKHIPTGFPRLLSLLPIFSLLLILPLSLHSFHLGGPTTFFLVWLATFKLLLFSFNKGPLSKHSLTLPHFILVSSLPIKLKTIKKPKNPFKPSCLNTTIKALLLGFIVWAYRYRSYMHPHLILALYCSHLYLGLELALALCATPALVFGFELEPQFNEPYLTTSLQDFWGRRWNLMVTNILRPTVYDPTRLALTSIIGPQWAQSLGSVAAFSVSGLMHELIYYYLSRAKPTWEVTWFFVLHGVCVAAEVAVKRKAAARGWRVHGVVSGVMTLVFLVVTGNWLFFPQLLRNGVVEKGIGEYEILVGFVKNKVSNVL